MESIQQQIHNHELMIDVLEYRLRCNSNPKSIFKGNSLNGEIQYHRREIERLQSLLNSTPNAPVSDTTGADSSNADGNKKIPSIDWEGLQKDSFNHFAEVAIGKYCSPHGLSNPETFAYSKAIEDYTLWLKTNISNYIK